MSLKHLAAVSLALVALAVIGATRRTAGPPSEPPAVAAPSPVAPAPVATEDLAALLARLEAAMDRSATAEGQAEIAELTRRICALVAGSADDAAAVLRLLEERPEGPFAERLARILASAPESFDAAILGRLKGASKRRLWLLAAAGRSTVVCREAVIDALGEPSLRIEACRALATAPAISRPADQPAFRAVEALKSMAREDTDAPTRVAAIQALARNARSSSATRQFLQQLAQTADDPLVRDNAQYVLSRALLRRRPGW